MTRRGKKDQCQQTDGHVSTEVLRVHATRLQPAPSHSTAQHATELRSAAPHPPQAPCTHHPSLLHPSFLLPLPLAMRAAPPTPTQPTTTTTIFPAIPTSFDPNAPVAVFNVFSSASRAQTEVCSAANAASSAQVVSTERPRSTCVTSQRVWRLALKRPAPRS